VVEEIKPVIDSTKIEEETKKEEDIEGQHQDQNEEASCPKKTDDILQPPHLRSRMKQPDSQEEQKITFLHGEEKGSKKSELERTVTLGAKSV